MTITGIRGTSRLTREELEAHLGLALRTENLGVLLGAGSSICAGGKTMAALWKAVTEQHPETLNWLVLNRFVGSGDGESVDVEEVIDRLAIAELDLDRRGEGNSADFKQLVEHRGVLYRRLLDASLLAAEFWDGGLDPLTAESLKHHRTLLARLNSSRSPGQDAPWVFSTNYDLAMEWAAEALSLEIINGFGGLHDRRFASSRFDLGFRNVQATGVARLGTYHIYLVKMHGSLTWCRSSTGAVQEVSAAHIWPQLQKMVGSDEEAAKLSELVVILPNTQKYLATSGYIHGELVRRLTEFLSRPQTTLLITGYSFNDEHLNRVVRSALNNPTLHLIAFLPEFRVGEDDYAQSLSPTARELVRALVSTSSPRVTFVGGAAAHFEELVSFLPEPALLDDVALQSSQVERRLASTREDGEVAGDAD